MISLLFTLLLGLVSELAKHNSGGMFEFDFTLSEYLIAKPLHVGGVVTCALHGSLISVNLGQGSLCSWAPRHFDWIDKNKVGQYPFLPRNLVLISRRLRLHSKKAILRAWDRKISQHLHFSSRNSSWRVLTWHSEATSLVWRHSRGVFLSLRQHGLCKRQRLRSTLRPSQGLVPVISAFSSDISRWASEERVYIETSFIVLHFS